jgi:hypothetical protein
VSPALHSIAYMRPSREEFSRKKRPLTGCCLTAHRHVRPNRALVRRHRRQRHWSASGRMKKTMARLFETDMCGYDIQLITRHVAFQFQNISSGNRADTNLSEFSATCWCITLNFSAPLKQRQKNSSPASHICNTVPVI